MTGFEIVIRDTGYRIISVVVQVPGKCTDARTNLIITFYERTADNENEHKIFFTKWVNVQQQKFIQLEIGWMMMTEQRSLKGKQWTKWRIMSELKVVLHFTDNQQQLSVKI